MQPVLPRHPLTKHMFVFIMFALTCCTSSKPIICPVRVPEAPALAALRHVNNVERAILSPNMRTHGHIRNGKRSGTYNTWRGMIERCRNPKSGSYSRYGAMGISVCERWETFEAFLEDMGERPEGHTIERKNNKLGYYPENCRWATSLDQQNNKKSNVLVTIDGRTDTIANWSRHFKAVPISTTHSRRKYGWTPLDALTKTAKQPRSKKSAVATYITDKVCFVLKEKSNIEVSGDTKTAIYKEVMEILGPVARLRT